MNRPALLLLAPLSLLAAACGSPADDGADDAAQELTRQSGIELAGSGADSALKITVTREKDRSDSTFDSYLTHARVSRGRDTFDCFCAVDAKLGPKNEETTVRCTKYTKAVDDNQSIDFEVALLNGAFSLRSVKMHGTQLGAELATLTGGSRGDKDLTSSRASTDPLKNPFAGTKRVAAALRPLLGAKAYSQQSNGDKKITGFEYSLSEHYDVSGTVYLDVRERGSFSFWMANEDYKAAKGLVTSAELGKRARASMPKAPQCTQGGAPGSVASPRPSIDNAMDILGGPNFGLTDEVKLSDVPAPIAAKLKKAGADIEKRSFPGSDYSASVAGYYAIHRSCTDSTIVAYVVWGTGAGEPDYHDGVVVGFDLNGNEIYNEETDG